MVFSSLPPYLDPSNWQHHHHPQQQQQSTGSSSSPNPQLSSPPPPPTYTGGGSSSTRPGSMSDRARMANIPMPEPALKCPRCESTNTKFCYFNNYSLSQPRHFCKTCRRYWTRGGALRSVPVGGGCRRNKRNKSKNTGNAAQASGGGATNSSSSTSSAVFAPNNNNSTGGGAVGDILGLTSPLRFMTPFPHLTELGAAGEMGLNYGETLTPPPPSDVNFPMGISNFLGGVGGGGSGSSFLMGGGEQWRFPVAAGTQQFPLMGGGGGIGLMEPPAVGLYPLDQFGGGAERGGYAGIRPEKSSGSMVLNQLASVKIEDGPNNSANREVLSHSFLEMNSTAANSNQYCWNVTSGAAPWTDLSGFSSSSAASNSNAL